MLIWGRGILLNLRGWGGNILTTNKCELHTDKILGDFQFSDFWGIWAICALTAFALRGEYHSARAELYTL